MKNTHYLNVCDMFGGMEKREEKVMNVCSRDILLFQNADQE